MVGIRAAESDEVETLARIGLAAWRKGLKPHVPDTVAARIERGNPFLPFLREMGSRVLVAVVDGSAAGIGACEHGDDYISDVWVSPRFEGRGAGKALVRALEREISMRGYPLARIDVAAANVRALQLYKHLGYTQAWRSTVQDPILEISLEKIGLVKSLSAT